MNRRTIIRRWSDEIRLEEKFTVIYALKHMYDMLWKVKKKKKNCR